MLLVVTSNRSNAPCSDLQRRAMRRSSHTRSWSLQRRGACYNECIEIHGSFFFLFGFPRIRRCRHGHPPSKLSRRGCMQSRRRVVKVYENYDKIMRTSCQNDPKTMPKLCQNDSKIIEKRCQNDLKIMASSMHVRHMVETSTTRRRKSKFKFRAPREI